MKVRDVGAGAAEGAMTVRTREEASAVVVVVTGEVGAENAHVLRASLDKAAATEPVRPVVLDMSEVPFIDSTCLGVLVRGHKALRAAGGSLSFVVVAGPVRRVLEISGLDSVLVLDETLDEALSRVSATEH